MSGRTVRLHVAIAVLLVLVHGVVAASRQTFPTARIDGVVLDSLRSPVTNATVSLAVHHHVIIKKFTGADGTFAFETAFTEDAQLIIEAAGFSRVELPINAAAITTKRIEIVLAPATITGEVTVTASRTPIGSQETAASVRVVSNADFTTTAAPTIDDALRQVPGFQLFRRSGSRFANPTAQGVSLRGVGASGASRAVVLVDGIPINDPFGGWIYWGRVPRQSLAQVEIVRGAVSDLYGSAALGGVVGLITKESTAPMIDFESSYGSEQSADASFFTGTRFRSMNFNVAGELQTTAGYIVVPESQRGIVDTPVNSRHSAVNFRLSYDRLQNLRLVFRSSYFKEARHNGTPLQTNGALIRELIGGADLQTRRLGFVSLRLYLSKQLLNQNFSAITPTRSAEALTRLQRVPAQVTGLSFQTARAIGDKQTLIFGVDAREVRGASDEIALVQGRAASFLGAGGRERDFGVFLKDVLKPTSRLTVTGGFRFDRWRDYKAHSDSRAVSGLTPVLVKSFGDRSESAISPQGSILYRPTERLGLFASAYGAFRAPTLNELYRSFRVGNVLTLANETLRAERLWGGEGGITLTPATRRLSFRGSLFWTQISRAIANLTIATTPDLITRERRNLGSTRARGVELDSDFKLRKYWSASVRYLLADSTVLKFPGTPAIEGRRIPQVARHNFTFQSLYANPSLLAIAVQARSGSSQFDDDLNAFRLPAYFTLDAFASRRLSNRAEIFLTAENIFDRQYATGQTPVVTLSPPRLFRVGLRLHLQKK
jgi:outer membrane receptor protein involved in Fe transport